MRVIDSHTAGEPTRLIIEGGPDLGGGPLSERRARFARDFDHIRSFVCNEPRGYDALVGGMIVEPVDRSCTAGVIFFNNATMLGMCGHGTIGLAVTLAHLGRIGPGMHRVETPVGIVTFDLIDRNTARITNVPARRAARAVRLDVPGLGTVTGDIAWGGNWFFLTEDAPCPVDHAHLAELNRAAQAMQDALNAAGLGGDDGQPVDHIEIFGKAAPGANSRSYVLCSGGAYDRSPCGTGTSAKLACLAADGKLRPDTDWVQESVIGSRFVARYAPGEVAGTIIPTITGSAYITGEATLIADPADPYRFGIR
jgi:4-hydroxyproline epimerase